MTAFLAPATLSCLRSTRVTSLSVVRHSFRFSSVSKPAVLPPLRGLRQTSGLATATKPATGELPTNNDQPTFSSLDGVLSTKVLQALTDNMKLTHMSAVQAEVLPLLPELARPYNPAGESADPPPRDLLVKAKTGTGKTLAFLLPAIEARLAAIENHIQQAAQDISRKADRDFERSAGLAYARENVGTLIISPTRELANQIAAEALRVTQHLPGWGVRTLVGGENKHHQMRGWMQGRRDIVVGTPGRLRDLLMSQPDVKRGMSKAQVLILDEADTLLDMGFRDDIEAIKEFLPPVPERQTFLFSATVSPAIRQIARSSLASNHAFIDCVSEDSSPVHAHVAQYHTVLPSASEQIPHLLRLIAHDQLRNPGASKIMVFLPTTNMTRLFATVLREITEATLPAGRRTRIFELHSKRRMESRTSTSDAFRADRSGASVLITSDVSARGVDYPNVSRVIQVGVPSSTEQYIHRVGRTGRANTDGRGDIVLLPWEMGYIKTSLNGLPLKPLTSKELASQVNELATKFDENPGEFFGASAAPPSRDGPWDRGSPAARPKHHLFAKSVQPVVQDIEQSTKDFLNTMDGEAIRETFMSNLGFYVSLASDLRVSKQEIVEGCKKWAMEGLGLTETPYVSAMFLQKIGLGGERKERSSSKPRTSPSSSFGVRRGGYGQESERRPSGWAERGQQRMRRDFDGGEGYRSRESFKDAGGYARRREGTSRGGFESGRRGRSDRPF